MINEHLGWLLMCRIPKFHQISWCENFVERHSFHRVSGKSPKTLCILCLSIKCLHQEIKWISVFYPVKCANIDSVSLSSTTSPLLDILDFSYALGLIIVNLFLPNAPILYPLKASENHKVFWCFQGIEKGCIGNEWV